MKFRERLRRLIQIPHYAKVVYVTNEPGGRPPSRAGDYRFELSLNSRELAALYALKGWPVQNATNEESIPGAQEILGILINLADSLQEGSAYNTTARLMAMKDGDFPGVTDFYLYIGNAHMAPSDDPTDDNAEVPAV